MDKAAVIELLAKATTVKDPSLYERMSMAQFDPNGQVDMESVRQDLAWFVENGYVKAPPDAGKLPDMSYLDYAVARNGKR